MKWQRWNRRAKSLLWIIVLIGVVAAMPLGLSRMTMEKSANTVEFIFDYIDLLEVAEQQPNPRQYLEEKLVLMKEAGVGTMSVYESTLRELQRSGRLVYYSERDAALLQGKLPDERVNHSYLLFNSAEDAEKIGPILEEGLDRYGVSYRSWEFGGRSGLIAEEPLAALNLKTFDFDPMTLEELTAAGFHILPRFSDRVVPYDSERTDAQLTRLKEFGVTRILFDGEKAKGASDQAELKSLDSFGALLKHHGLGITVIENLKKPQQGIHKLAYVSGYDVVRLYSLSAEESIEISASVLKERFLLAAKDRNIRMFFLNTMLQSSSDTGRLNDSVDKLASAVGGENGAIALLAEEGFPNGVAQPFAFDKASWEKPLRALAVLGAIALIALLISAYVPHTAIPLFLLGLVGSAGLFVLNSSLLEQALALGAAVSAPTLGVIWALNRIYSRTLGQRRMIGGESWTVGGSGHPALSKENRTTWVFPEVPAARRLAMALGWFIGATVISLSAVPIVFGLLNNITYSLVLEQFRGVSALHFGPLVLVAIYVFLYEDAEGNGVWKRGVALLKQPITLLWVAAAVVIGAIGFYYISRTGNSGHVTPIELLVRGWLESAFGVRPRFKEFMLGHPPLLLGLFLAIRYRAAWVLIIVGTMGQLTMVSTFTHIHTPLYISIIRTLLGLGAGLIFGLIAIGIWTAAEGVFRKWILPRIPQKSV